MRKIPNFVANEPLSSPAFEAWQADNWKCHTRSRAHHPHRRQQRDEPYHDLWDLRMAVDCDILWRYLVWSMWRLRLLWLQDSPVSLTRSCCALAPNETWPSMSLQLSWAVSRSRCRAEYLHCYRLGPLSISPSFRTATLADWWDGLCT